MMQDQDTDWLAIILAIVFLLAAFYFVFLAGGWYAMAHPEFVSPVHLPGR